MKNRLLRRARLATRIREFMAANGVLEVVTPVLSAAAVTDPQIESFASQSPWGTRYLRTSPEFAHKRLLSQGAPDLFEMGPVFRQAECGNRHNPEFTLLEWYRLGYSMQQLIDEVIELLRRVDCVSEQAPVEQLRYFDAFERVLGFSVTSLSTQELSDVARQVDGPVGELDRDQWLDFLFATRVQPTLTDRTVVITHYPASQAALAKLDAMAPDTALRFEVFVRGLELANGFEELTCAVEQRARFDNDNALRVKRGQSALPIDERFLTSLDTLPPCAGVALGIDRLLMLLDDCTTIDEVLTFGWHHI
ncbi:MAG: EF-P lysine aminoacylase EpmA [Pseudomonadota bacterium]